MDRKPNKSGVSRSVLDAPDADISLRVDPDAATRPVGQSGGNVYQQSLQEIERRRQVVANRRPGGAPSINSFDAMARRGGSGAGAGAAPSLTAEQRRNLKTHVPEMMLKMPDGGPKTDGDIVKFDSFALDPAGGSTTGLGGGATLSRPDAAPPRKAEDVRMEKYGWFTCNVANKHCGPSCPRPAVRVTGFFHDEAAADAHMEVEAKHPVIGMMGIATYKFKAGHLVMAGITPERTRSKAVIDAKKVHLFNAHNKWMEERMTKFQENLEQHKHGEVGASGRHRQQVKRAQDALRKTHPVPPEELARRDAQMAAFREYVAAQKAKAETEEPTAATATTTTKAQEPDAYPKDLEVRGQSWVAMTVVQDEAVTVDDGPDAWAHAEGAGFEPIFIAQTACRTAEDVDRVCKGAIWNKFLDADTLPAPMYEWLMLDDVDNPTIQNNWFDAEQDLVMKRQEQDVQEALKFAELCDTAGKRVPVIDITDPDGTGMIPAMRKGELTDEEKAAVADAEAAQKERDAVVLGGTLAEARAAQKKEETSRRGTFIKADGTVAKPE